MKSGIGPVARRLGAPLVIAAALACHAGASAAQTVFVDGVSGNDAWDGLCEEWDGGTCGPKKTIQAGVNIAYDGDDISVADAVYSGSGNINIVYEGKAINVHSADGPDNCIIDVAYNSLPAFKFIYGEQPTSVLDGFTIIHCGGC